MTASSGQLGPCMIFPPTRALITSSKSQQALPGKSVGRCYNDSFRRSELAVDAERTTQTRIIETTNSVALPGFCFAPSRPRYCGVASEDHLLWFRVKIDPGHC